MVGLVGGPRRFRVRLTEVVPGLTAPPASVTRSAGMMTGASVRLRHVYKTKEVISAWADWRDLILDSEAWMKEFNLGDGLATTDLFSGTWFEGYNTDKYPPIGEANNAQSVSVQWITRKTNSSILSFGNLDEQIVGLLPPNGNLLSGDQQNRYYSKINATWSHTLEDAASSESLNGDFVPIKYRTDDFDDGKSPLVFALTGAKVANYSHGEILATLHFVGTPCQVRTKKNKVIDSTGYYVVGVHGGGIIRLYAQAIVNEESQLFLVGQTTSELTKAISPQIPLGLAIYREKGIAIIPFVGPLDRLDGPGQNFGSSLGDVATAVAGVASATPGIGGNISIATISGVSSSVTKHIAVGLSPYLTYCSFKVGYVPYSDEAEIYDDLVNMGWPVGLDTTDSNPLQVNIQADIPTGTSLTVEVFNSDGDPLTQLTSLDNGTRTTFSLNEAETYMRLSVKISFNTFTDGTVTRTPFIYAYSMGINGKYVVDPEFPDEIILQGHAGMIEDFVPYADNIGDVRMSYSFTDVADLMDVLKVRPTWGFNFECCVDEPADVSTGLTMLEKLDVVGETWHCLFWGITTLVTDTPLQDDKVRYSISARSMWHLVAEQSLFIAEPLFSPFGLDRLTARKASELVERFLNLAGINPTQIDILDDPTRVFLDKDNATPAIVNPGKNIGEVILGIIKVYLPQYFFVDHGLRQFRSIALTEKNATPIVELNKSNYGSGIHMALGVKNYFTALDMEDIPQIAWISRTSKKQNIPPDFNFLVVTAIGRTDAGKTAGAAEAVWFNPESTNITIGDVTSDLDNSLKGPSWLGRLVPYFIFLPTLNSFAKGEEVARACALVARRVGEFAGNGYTQVSRTIPLVLIPHESDPAVLRTLRYQDPVKLTNDGDTFLVRSVVGTGWKKTSMATTNVTCERIFDSKGIIPA